VWEERKEKKRKEGRGKGLCDRADWFLRGYFRVIVKREGAKKSEVVLHALQKRRRTTSIQKPYSKTVLYLVVWPFK
jgi:hypothetical protein